MSELPAPTRRAQAAAEQADILVTPIGPTALEGGGALTFPTVAAAYSRGEYPQVNGLFYGDLRPRSTFFGLITHGFYDYVSSL